MQHPVGFQLMIRLCIGQAGAPRVQAYRISVRAAVKAVVLLGIGIKIQSPLAFAAERAVDMHGFPRVPHGKAAFARGLQNWESDKTHTSPCFLLHRFNRLHLQGLAADNACQNKLTGVLRRAEVAERFGIVHEQRVIPSAEP